jgi:hypothetical protein
MPKNQKLILISMIISAYILSVYGDCPRNPVEGCLGKALKEYSLNGEKCYQCDDSKTNACQAVACPADCNLMVDSFSSSNLCHLCACN